MELEQVNSIPETIILENASEKDIFKLLQELQLINPLKKCTKSGCRTQEVLARNTAYKGNYAARCRKCKTFRSLTIGTCFENISFTDELTKTTRFSNQSIKQYFKYLRSEVKRNKMDQALSRCVCRCKIDPLAQDNPVLFKFPDNPDMRDKWLQAIKDGSGCNFGAILETSSLCSAHFKEEDLDRSSSDCLTVKEYAVPSVFDTFLPTRSSSRIETVTSATFVQEESVPPSLPPGQEEAKPNLRIHRRKQTFTSKEVSGSPPKQSELDQLEDSKDMLRMKSMSEELDEMETSTDDDDDLEASENKMDVTESDPTYTRPTSDESDDDKPLSRLIKIENISPPSSPSPRKNKKKRFSLPAKKLRQRRILPKPADPVVSTPRTRSTRSDPAEPGAGVNMTETLVKQAQKVGKLEQENKRLKTMVDNYENILKEMGVIVNMKFLSSR